MDEAAQICVEYQDDFVIAHEQLMDELRNNVAWDERMRARRTASFGRPYNYSGMVYPEVVIPANIEQIRAAVAVRCAFEPNNCLVNYYELGRYTMGFHADNTTELVAATGVAVVSLGATRTMVFREIAHRDRELRLALRGGSLLYLPPHVHHAWLHGIPRERGAGPRISLTFRALNVLATQQDARQ